MVGLALGTLLAFGLDAARGPLPQPRFWIIFLTSGAIAAMLFHRFLTVRGGFMPVRLDLGSVTLRMSTGQGMPLWEIPFRNLRITRPEDNPREALLINGPGIRFLLNARQLIALDGREIDDPIDALKLLEHQLVTRSRGVATQPGGPAIGGGSTVAEQMTVGNADAPSETGVDTPPSQPLGRSMALGPATLTISAILGLVFILQWRLGAVFSTAGFDPITLLALGANSSPLVQGGEWQRLITGNLLHGDLRHLLFNGFALISFGRVVEGRLGTARFLTIFLSACLGGTLASAFLNDVLMSVGASTGILGLVGAYGAIDWYFANDRKGAARRQAILLFLALVLPAILVPNADHFGHAGGLLVGLALTGWFLSPLDAVTPRMLDAASRSANVRQVLSQWLPGGRLPDDHQRQRHRQRLKIARIAAVVLVLLFVAITAWTGWHFLTDGKRSEALALIDTPDLPKFFVNNAAWTLAIDSQSTREQLITARDAMVWAEDPELQPASAEIDTLATLYFRLGDLDKAIALERWAFALDPDAVIAAQMARFSVARLDRQREPYLDGYANPPQITLHHDAAAGCATVAGESSPDHDPGTPAGVAVGFPTAEPAAATDDSGEPVPPEIHVLLRTTDQPLALLRVRSLDDSAQRVLCVDMPEDLIACDVQAEVSLAATTPAIPAIPVAESSDGANDSLKTDNDDGSACNIFRLDEDTLDLPGVLGGT